MNAFKDWCDTHIADEYRAIAVFGADINLRALSHKASISMIYTTFCSEIWEILIESSDRLGYRNVFSYLSELKKFQKFEQVDEFEKELVWIACEEIAKTSCRESLESSY